MIARAIRAIRAPSGEGGALRALLALIVITMAARWVLAGVLGLGVDEAYTVSTSRVWQLSTFDHPPLAWWLAAGARRWLGSESPLAVRLPFILLSAVSTALIYDAGRYLYSARAGFYAALTFNLAPVLGWTSGTMVLPDGPLLAALLAGLCCLARAFFGDPRGAPRWWLLAGAATGVACLAKLHGVFLLAGTGLFILSTPGQRFWLASRWPYLATLVALVIFSPVLIWNAEHHWISFAFQAGRAASRRLDAAGPLVALAGQALFLLPWVWAALVISLARAWRAGPQQPRDWLLFCLAIGPIAVFALVALGGTKTLFHWAAPGYLFACVLLGRDLGHDLAAGDRLALAWRRGAIGAMVVVFCAVVGLARLPWPMVSPAGGKPLPYPLIETQSWADLRTALAARGWLGQPRLFVAAVKWHEAGRIDVALGGALPVRCLCLDPRDYGMMTDNRAMVGQDALMIGPGLSSDDVAARFGAYFTAITPQPPVAITHAGRPIQTLRVFLARGFRDPGGPRPNMLAPFAAP